MYRKKLVIRLLSEAIDKCNGIVDKLSNKVHNERWDGPPASWYEPPDEPDLPEECPDCGGELDYSDRNLPCIGTPCGWTTSSEDGHAEMPEKCPKCGGEVDDKTLQTGEEVYMCKGKGCGFNLDASWDGPDDSWDRWD